MSTGPQKNRKEKSFIHLIQYYVSIVGIGYQCVYCGLAGIEPNTTNGISFHMPLLCIVVCVYMHAVHRFQVMYRCRKKGAPGAGVPLLYQNFSLHHA